jgi:hypothetical protein
MDSIQLFDYLLDSLSDESILNSKTNYDKCIKLDDCAIFMLDYHFNINKKIILKNKKKKQYIYDKLFAYALIKSKYLYDELINDEVLDSNITHEIYTKETWLNDSYTINDHFMGHGAYINSFVADISLRNMINTLIKNL